ncbi:MAG: hypothetical protein HY885_17890 [Deltaproteobacteria bacterium]|nr:hypothetical protein [Deltaproteobacteria bacterium]
MKNMFTRIIVLLAVTILGSGLCWAGNGKGAADGTGPIHDITAGVPFEYTGTVVSYVQGEGLILDITTEEDAQPVEVVISGIGPEFYWENLGVARPVAGDIIIVSGYTVAYDDTEVNIAVEITLTDGTVVVLRDEDGAPLWRQSGKKQASKKANR